LLHGEAMANLADPDEASEKFASFQTDSGFQSDLEIGLGDALATSSPSAIPVIKARPTENSPFLAVTKWRSRLSSQNLFVGENLSGVAYK